ncbi:MAG: transcription elongation factor NusA, partial [Pseudomonadota bacterium]
DLATDELIAKKRTEQRRRNADPVETKGGVLAVFNLSEAQGNEVIMAARAHWFEDEEGGADAAVSQ